jgi:hypothetical protein
MHLMHFLLYGLGQVTKHEIKLVCSYRSAKKVGDQSLDKNALS